MRAENYVNLYVDLYADQYVRSMHMMYVTLMATPAWVPAA